MYTIDDRLYQLAQQVLEEHETEFTDILTYQPTIAYMRCDESKKKNGRTTYADCEKVSV